jgi:hypothetical protein
LGWPQVPPSGVGFPALESPNLNLPGRIIFITTHFCALQTSCNNHDADDDVDDDDDDDDDDDNDDDDNDDDDHDTSSWMPLQAFRTAIVFLQESVAQDAR